MKTAATIHKNRGILVLLAFAGCTALAAIAVVTSLGGPPRNADWPAFLGSTFVLSLLGPLLFAWAWGPGPMGVVATTTAIFFPALSLASLYFGFIKGRSLLWLVVSATIWGAFGGFSAWVAITGSV